MTFDKNQTVREIAIQNPATAQVFERFGIDYCCGGKRLLQEACQSANARLNDVLQALDKSEASSITTEERLWDQCSLTDLTAHIVGRHHRYVRDQALRIEVLLQKVINHHADAHPELGVIQEIFMALSQELLAHMMKEERVLFPFLEEMEVAAREGRPVPPGCFASVEMPISRMLADHDDAGALLAKMRDLSGGYRGPNVSCSSYHTLYQAMEEFERDLHHHIHLENNILFPRAVEMERSLQETAHVGH